MQAIALLVLLVHVASARVRPQGHLHTEPKHLSIPMDHRQHQHLKHGVHKSHELDLEQVHVPSKQHELKEKSETRHTPKVVEHDPSHLFRAGADLELLKLKISQSEILSSSEKGAYLETISTMEHQLAKLSSSDPDLSSVERSRLVHDLKTEYYALRHVPQKLKSPEMDEGSFLADPSLAQAMTLVSNMKSNLAEKLNPDERHNLDALSMDLEMLRVSSDPDESKDLAMAIRWRIPQLQALADRFKHAEAAPSNPQSHRHSRDLEQEEIKSNDFSSRGLEYINQLKDVLQQSDLTESKKDFYRSKLDSMTEDFNSVNPSTADPSQKTIISKLKSEVKILHSMEEDIESHEKMEPQSKQAKHETLDPVQQDQEEQEVPAIETVADVEAERAQDPAAAHDGDADSDVLLSVSLEKIKAVMKELDDSSMPEDKKARLISNLKGLERDAKAIKSDTLTQEQRSDLESAMKLRVAMLADMEKMVDPVQANDDE